MVGSRFPSALIAVTYIWTRASKGLKDEKRTDEGTESAVEAEKKLLKRRQESCLTIATAVK